MGDEIYQTIQSYIGSVSYSELAMPIGVVMWSFLIFISLANIDCSNFISSLIYSTYSCLTGVVIVFIIPGQYIGRKSFEEMVVWITIFVVVPQIRWWRVAIQQKKQKT